MMSTNKAINIKELAHNKYPFKKSAQLVSENILYRNRFGQTKASINYTKQHIQTGSKNLKNFQQFQTSNKSCTLPTLKCQINYFGSEG